MDISTSVSALPQFAAYAQQGSGANIQQTASAQPSKLQIQHVQPQNSLPDTAEVKQIAESDSALGRFVNIKV
jgi:hypothetical protein